ncbi:MAG: hypothetical protein SOX31_05430 [Eubacteriales bacterium]|nr:hypothetical protein [Eubacteriales bacterium]MDY3285999.1 hypothetical protein [Eubacteriales bacterium]MDY5015568.1 hypothetical protein [Eubacteriales bacterium]
MQYQYRTILVTGFEPFQGRTRNPSSEAVAQLPDELYGCRIVKETLPVVWFDSVYQLEKRIETLHPRMVIMVGQGHSAPPIRLERLGVNMCFGSDNSDENDFRFEPIFPNGPAAYFSTFPYEPMHRRLKEEGIPVRYSFSAGQYLCNCMLYTALHFAATRFPHMQAGFIHVPMLPEDNIEGMPIEVTAKAIRCCVEEAAKSISLPVRTPAERREDL